MRDFNAAPSQGRNILNYKETTKRQRRKKRKRFPFNLAIWPKNLVSTTIVKFLSCLKIHALTSFYISQFYTSSKKKTAGSVRLSYDFFYGHSSYSFKGRESRDVKSYESIEVTKLARTVLLRDNGYAPASQTKLSTRLSFIARDEYPNKFNGTIRRETLPGVQNEWFG